MLENVNAWIGVGGLEGGGLGQVGADGDYACRPCAGGEAEVRRTRLCMLMAPPACLPACLPGRPLLSEQHIVLAKAVCCVWESCWLLERCRLAARAVGLWLVVAPRHWTWPAIPFIGARTTCLSGVAWRSVAGPAFPLNPARCHDFRKPGRP